MDGSNRRRGDGVAANGAQIRNKQMQALFALLNNEERLKKWRDFAVDKGPELMGDLFCPWAKWTFLLLAALINSEDDTLKLFIAHIFGTQSPHSVKSPLQIISSSLRTASEEVLRDADIKADLRTGVLAVCRATTVMLIMWMGDLGWKWFIVLHFGLFVAQTNLQFSKDAPHLVFQQAIHVFLFVLGAVSPTSLCHFLLHEVGSVFATIFYVRNVRPMIAVILFSSILMIFFYTPLWFGACVALAIATGAFADSCDPNDIIPCALFMCACLCVVRLVVYVSGGGVCGALFVFLSPILLLCGPSSHPDAPVEMVTPLPLVCALISCLYTPFWVGLCFTSTLICMLAAANDNAKAILWWFVSFATVHSMSYAFSRNFTVVGMCFLGSYFSYGCIL